MKRETRLLFEKACDALVLSIELFNRPHDRGRISATLIHLDHGLEMLLKAAILHSGGRIRDSENEQTIGFASCLGRGLSDGNVKFLTNDQAIALRAINHLRDAAQHHLLDISENQLYVHIQSAITVFRELVLSVFQKKLISYLPVRTLPISTSPPTDIVTIFESEVADILKLLKPGRRRTVQAEAKIAALSILDSVVRGEEGRPNTRNLKWIAERLSERPWQEVFKGASVIEIATEGAGPTLSVRLTRNEGPPMQITPEGTLGASPVAVRRVNELDFYNLTATQLATKIGLTVPKLIAVVEFTNIRNNPDCYKEFRFGTSSTHKRYSQKAIEVVRGILLDHTIEKIWNWYKQHRWMGPKGAQSPDLAFPQSIES